MSSELRKMILHNYFPFLTIFKEPNIGLEIAASEVCLRVCTSVFIKIVNYRPLFSKKVGPLSQQPPSCVQATDLAMYLMKGDTLINQEQTVQ